jgi:biopolymer transport protein ExbD
MKQLSAAILIVFLFSGCTDFIAFFGYTATAAAPTPMKLFLPRDSEEAKTSFTTTTADSVLTLLLTSGKVFYYTEDAGSQKHASTVSYKDLREVLLEHKERAGSHLVVVIKPTETCTYRNTVDVLDEMTINEIKRYALVDLTDEEREIVNLPLAKKPDNTITVTVPKAVKGEVKSIPAKTDFVITVHEDKSLSCNDNKLISPPTKENIKKAILTYQASLGEEKDRLRVVVRGPKDAKYDSFQAIMGALKELDIFKFSFEENTVN